LRQLLIHTIDDIFKSIYAISFEIDDISIFHPNYIGCNYADVITFCNKNVMKLVIKLNLGRLVSDNIRRKIKDLSQIVIICEL